MWKCWQSHGVETSPSLFSPTQRWSLSHCSVAMCLYSIAFLALLLGGPDAEAETRTECPSPLVSTQKSLTCKKSNWKACSPGSVVRNPACVAECRDSHVLRCNRLRSRQRVRCQGSLKKVIFCPDLAKKWRRQWVEFAL